MYEECKKDQLAGLLVAIVAFIVYANSLGNGFAWDDAMVVVNNQLLRGAPLSLFSGIDTARDIELTPYYRPLTLLTFLFEERLHGLTPYLMHLFNVLLHALNTFLVYRLARTIIDNRNAALLTGLLFAVHPINAEGVNFIAGGRNTLLACCLVLSTYLLHRRSAIAGNKSARVVAPLFFLAALFAKETALAVLPFIIALETVSMRTEASGPRYRALARLAPYAACTAIYFFLRKIALDKAGVEVEILPGMWSRLLDNLYIIPRYLLSLIWPPAISPVYFVPDDLNLLALPLSGAWLGIAAVLGWLFTRGRSRETLFGLAWLTVFWLPVSGIISFPSAPLADRYLYIPAIGLWLVIACQVTRLLPSNVRARRYAAMASTLPLLVLAALTAARNPDWKNDISLFSRYVRQYPERAVGHHNLGTAYLDLVGDLDKAEQEFETTLTLDPHFPRLHTQMGYIRLLRGDYQEALRHYTEAVLQNPQDAEALLNRGKALENLGRYAEAVIEYKRFLAAPGNELAAARPLAEAKIRDLSRLSPRQATPR